MLKKATGGKDVAAVKITDKSTATPNYIQEYFQNQNLFPNPKPISKDANDSILKNVAQEQAYWTQMGTTTFTINKKYRNPRLEVKGGKPALTKPKGRKLIHDPR